MSLLRNVKDKTSHASRKEVGIGQAWHFLDPLPQQNSSGCLVAVKAINSVNIVLQIEFKPIMREQLKHILVYGDLRTPIAAHFYVGTHW